MSLKRTHDELIKFVYDLDLLSINMDESCIDDVWKYIIYDVQEYNKRDKYKWYYGYPPVQNFTLEQSDRPDIIYKCNEFVMGIECFEFDSSKKTRKGSKQKQREREVERDIREEYRHALVPKGGFLSIERHVDVELSITSYYKSLMSTFKTHAKSIADYRKNLSGLANDKRIMLSFYIEDTTAIGNYMSVKGRVEALDPLKIPGFLEELSLVQGLDYIMIKTSDLYVPSLRIQRVSDSLLDELFKNCYGPNDKFIQYQYKREVHYWG